MFDYKNYFDKFCRDNKLKLSLSYDMPKGYETANGTFDVAKKIVFINKEMLADFPEIEQCFYLFHELRHAMQYLSAHLFDDYIVKSMQYVIMFDGTCYKLIDGKYYKVKLEGEENYFLQLYKGQPYEVDANIFAFEKTKELYGMSNELQDLYEFYLHNCAMDMTKYEEIYSLIDKEINLMESI